MLKDGECDSFQRQKEEANKNEDRDDDGSDDDDDVGVRTGRILADGGRGETRTDCGGCFVGPATSELLTGSSLRLCGEAGTTWQVGTVF